MQLNPSEISELIKNKIQNLATASEVRTQGTVVSVTDGICRIHGLADVMQGEMLEFPGNTFGLALNLERDSVGAVVLGAYEHISEGDPVKSTGRILEVPVGPELIANLRQHSQPAIVHQQLDHVPGRAVDAFPADGKQQAFDIDGSDFRITDRRLHLGILVDRGDECQLVRPGGKRVATLGQAENGFRVRPGDGCEFGHAGVT